MTTKLRAKKSVVHEQFGDETVIVNLDTGCYYSVQGVGDTIWAWVVANGSRDGIVQRVLSEYSGDPVRLAQQTQAFLDRLVEEALVDPIAAELGDAVNENHEMAGEKKVFVAPSIEKYTDMEELLQLDPVHEVDLYGWPEAKKATT
ncbi:MAG: PqqD family protein [Rhizomicrobium sp.]